MAAPCIVFTVDFEACDGYGLWIAYAAGVFSYPSGRCIESLVRYIKRPLSAYDDARKEFWLVNHKTAHDWICTHGEDISHEEKYERELVQFIREAHRRYPHMRVISDNPSYDLRILDNLCQKYKAPPCTQRHDGKWHHPICTYTYALVVQLWLGTRNTDLLYNMSAAKHQRTTRQSDSCEPPHTPWTDVQQLVYKYFRILDLTNQFAPPLSSFATDR